MDNFKLKRAAASIKGVLEVMKDTGKEQTNRNLALLVLRELPPEVREFQHSEISTINAERKEGYLTVNQIQAKEYSDAILSGKEYSFEQQKSFPIN